MSTKEKKKTFSCKLLAYEFFNKFFYKFIFIFLKILYIIIIIVNLLFIVFYLPIKYKIFIDIERLNTEDEYESRSESSACSLNLSMTVQIVKGERYYNTSFAMYVASEEEEGLYNLHFHNCPNYKYDSQVALDFTVRSFFFFFTINY